jgi:hypothetical protein
MQRTDAAGAVALFDNCDAEPFQRQFQSGGLAACSCANYYNVECLHGVSLRVWKMMLTHQNQMILMFVGYREILEREALLPLAASNCLNFSNKISRVSQRIK